MLEYFSTGISHHKTLDNQKFLPLMGCQDFSARLDQRNYQNQFRHEHKQASKLYHDKEIYRKNYQKLQTDKDAKKKYYKPQYDQSLQQKIEQNKPQGQENSRDIFLKEKCQHLSNWKLIKKRQFALQDKQISENLPRKGKVMTQYNFSKSKNQKYLQDTQQDQNYLNRMNLYRSKPLLKLDKDFDQGPLIKNVQTTSKDTPLWYQTTNKYYKPEFVDKTKKIRQKTPPKTDIFNNKLQTYENNFQFTSTVPSKGMRESFPHPNMVVIEKSQLMENRDPLNSKKDKVRLDWAENPKKQNYDRINQSLTLKINQRQTTINRTQSQFNDPGIAFRKEYQPVKKNNMVQIKIGHGAMINLNDKS